VSHARESVDREGKVLLGICSAWDVGRRGGRQTEESGGMKADGRESRQAGR
jgi:hypothetical protein